MGSQTHCELWQLSTNMMKIEKKWTIPLEYSQLHIYNTYLVII